LTEHPIVKAHCRKCGGVRRHAMLHKEVRDWKDDDYPVYGSDTYEILECCGCETIGFRHSHYFSEDIDEEGNPISHFDHYPPFSTRVSPDWTGTQLFLSLKLDETWIVDLLKQIYSSVGLKSYSLAAMGARAIVDAIVTAEAGDIGSFPDKLNRLIKKGMLDDMRSKVIHAAFDAGSATAHRGYELGEADLYTLLDIMESTLYAFRIKPEKDKKDAKAAETLRQNTPPRKKGS